MDKETQDTIGRALYEISMDFTDSRTPLWEDLIIKGAWIRKAEAVVEAYEQHRQRVTKSHTEGQETALQK